MTNMKKLAIALLLLTNLSTMAEAADSAGGSSATDMLRYDKQPNGTAEPTQ